MCMFVYVYFYNFRLKTALTHVKCTIWKINYKHLYYFETYAVIAAHRRKEERARREEKRGNTK